MVNSLENERKELKEIRYKALLFLVILKSCVLLSEGILVHWLYGDVLFLGVEAIGLWVVVSDILENYGYHFQTVCGIIGPVLENWLQKYRN